MDIRKNLTKLGLPDHLPSKKMVHGFLYNLYITLALDLANR